MVESHDMAQAPLKLPAPPHGVVASLVAGFEAVNARLELILLPLLLDLFLWLGPHVSIRPLVSRLLGVLAAPPGADAATLRNLEIVRSALSDYGATFNLFSMLSTAPLGLPSLIGGRAAVTTPRGAALTWYVDSLPLYLLLLGAFVLVGLFLGALYFGGIAQQIRDRRLSLALLAQQVWVDWARLTALGAVALAVVLLLGTPVLLVTGVLSLFSPLVGLVVWVLGSTVILWALFYAAFALHSMLLHRRGLFGALWDSLRLVQFNLPHAAGLFVVVVLINVGLGLVWNIPQDDSWFLLLGVAAHALISTALVSATFVFYQDRFRWWTEMRRTLQARAEAEHRGLHRKA